jgi:acyl carrier protein
MRLRIGMCFLFWIRSRFPCTRENVSGWLARVGAAKAPYWLIRPGSLPKTPSGKIQRAWAAAIQLAQITPQLVINTCGLDSLATTHLRASVKESLGVDIPLMDLLQGIIIAQLAAQISKSCAALPWSGEILLE